MRPRSRITTTATAAAALTAVLAVTAGCGAGPTSRHEPGARPSEVMEAARSGGVLDEPARGIHHLAHRAAARLDLHPPILTATPAEDRHAAGGLMGWVGEPVTFRTATPSGRVRASVTTPYVTVTVTATAPRTTIATGDGTTLACRPAGSPCRHTYTRSSLGEQGGTYRVTASTRWRVTYTATTGHTGPVDLPALTATTRLRVANAAAVEAWRHTGDL